MANSKGKGVLYTAGGIITLGILCKKGLLPDIKIPLPFGLSWNLCGMFDPPSMGDFGNTFFGAGGSYDKGKIIDYLQDKEKSGAVSISGQLAVGSGFSLPEKPLRKGARLKSTGCSDANNRFSAPGEYLGTVKEVALDANKGVLRYKVTDGPFVYGRFDHAWINWKCVQDENEIIL